MIKDEILNFIQGGKEPPKPMKIDIYKAEKARRRAEANRDLGEYIKIKEKGQRELEKLREEWRKESDRMSYSKEREHER